MNSNDIWASNKIVAIVDQYMINYKYDFILLLTTYCKVWCIEFVVILLVFDMLTCFKGVRMSLDIKCVVLLAIISCRYFFLMLCMFSYIISSIMITTLEHSNSVAILIKLYQISNVILLICNSSSEICFDIMKILVKCWTMNTYFTFLVSGGFFGLFSHIKSRNVGFSYLFFYLTTLNLLFYNNVWLSELTLL